MKNSIRNTQYAILNTKAFVLILLCLILTQTTQAATTNQISQYGITWTFDKEYEYGQFANGDYWVVGPVKIIQIDPFSTDNSGRIKNGSMINPSPTNGAQGYDNQMAYNTYDNTLNAAYNVSTQNPLVVPANSSLVSTISVDNPQQTPQLYSAAILTVLSSSAPAGSFRPPYSGTDKTIKFNKSSPNYSLLKKLAPVSGTPALATVERYFERPWIDHQVGWNGRLQHPSQNMPNYGREISLQIGDGALMLNLNFSDSEKEKLLIRYVQLGIDLFGIIESGGSWYNNGGHASARKWPILFAGLILNDPDMKNIGQKSGDYLYSGSYGPGHNPPDCIHFGEDDQTFYVSQADVDITHSAKWYPDSRDAVKTPYVSADLGLPEWGIVHATNPEQSNAWWNTQYRQCCTAVAWAGFTLATRIMGVKDLWNHDAMFDYMDRYMSAEKDWRQWSALAINMWDTYRANYGCVYTSLNQTTHKRVYNCSGVTVDCSLISQCSDYPNQQAKDDDPCKANCNINIIYGDVSGDGKISAYDAALTAQASVGIITLTAEQEVKADVDGNGQVTAYDAALIAQYGVGLIAKFPLEP